MTEVFTPTGDTASAESPTSDRVLYAMPIDVFAAFRDGASVSVEEFPRGEIVAAAKRADHSAYDAHSPLVISLTKDSVGGAAIDTVWFHPDEDARLETIDRARTALDNAEAALLAVGYMDRVHLCTEDYMTAPQRERNAFEIGRDVGRGQSES